MGGGVVFSTLGDCHEYTGGYQDACGVIMSTLGVQYTGGIPWVHWDFPSVHRRDTMSTPGLDSIIWQINTLVFRHCNFFEHQMKSAYGNHC